MSEPETLNEPVTVQKKKKAKKKLTFMCNFQGFSENFQTLSQNARKFMKVATVKCSLPKIAWPECYSKKY